MIDLSTMKGVAVDGTARTAHAEPGVTWDGFNLAIKLHGLATTGGVVSTTGIAGSPWVVAMAGSRASTASPSTT